LTLRIVRDANAARLRNPFKTGGDIDAVAKDIIFIDYDVTDVDANAKFDPLVLWDRSILLGHAALDFNGTAHRIHGTGKLDEHAIAGRLDDAAAMGGYSGINNGLSDRLEPGQRAFLVKAHQTAPATSAARTAASRLSTRSPVKECL
jgi:hypothetical protein